MILLVKLKRGRFQNRPRLRQLPNYFCCCEVNYTYNIAKICAIFRFKLLHNNVLGSEATATGGQPFQERIRRNSIEKSPRDFE